MSTPIATAVATAAPFMLSLPTEGSSWAVILGMVANAVLAIVFGTKISMTVRDNVKRLDSIETFKDSARDPISKVPDHGMRLDTLERALNTRLSTIDVSIAEIRIALQYIVKGPRHDA